MNPKPSYAILWFVFIFMVSGLAFAQGTTSPSASSALPSPAVTKEVSPEGSTIEADAAPSEAPTFVWEHGPKKIDLGHDIQLDLPEGYLYLDKAQTPKFKKVTGNLSSPDEIGILASESRDEQWFIVMAFDDSGYIRDNETLDADAILKSIQNSNQEANKERTREGLNPLHVDGWNEFPRYDTSLHHLIWSLAIHSDDEKVINHRTRILGRYGYVSLNLVTSPETIARDTESASTVLKATHFKVNARYEDYDKENDKVAEYGLTGLILGGAGIGAAKVVKIGLLAKFGQILLVLLVKTKGAIVLVFAPLISLVKKLFKTKRPNHDE